MGTPLVPGWQHEPLDEGTVQRLHVMFSQGDWDTAERMLERGLANARCRRAALKVSGGRVDRLREAIELGNWDFRDLLGHAGFASDTLAHEKWNPESKAQPGECQ